MHPDVIKSSGNKAKFSIAKLRSSLLKSGANQKMVSSIIDEIRDELYQGISTREIYNRAFALLKNYKGAYASRYKLKKALYELGPTGFIFEKYISKLLNDLGFQTELNQIMQGVCVHHEVDIIANKEKLRHLIECKFHSEEGRNCDVKIPLYINSRFQDIYAFEKNSIQGEGWVVTNTKFSKDAITYGKCSGLKLLSWDYPEQNCLKVLIDKVCAYPVTTSTLLSDNEKLFLLERQIILGKELLENPFYLDHRGIAEHRKERILAEFKILCELNYQS
ncbi:ATP cone domain-containing protein [Christiangramia sp. SM2212]|uniref:Restriction endonuclease n=1 Tax=Christiangramia sediminicola TaxID=3073267 RepID=A0ABU1END5_9FLAO|nr:ATP cone domain-containing protein [Christiangramia sp. SM2212]MDR5589901.1 restriction endonuclease [Christiangramia sp. SM2212]